VTEKGEKRPLRICSEEREKKRPSVFSPSTEKGWGQKGEKDMGWFAWWRKKGRHLSSRVKGVGNEWEEKISNL